jgi:class 3 adenylate cyclase/DNA-binding response OmpR family regulator
MAGETILVVDDSRPTREFIVDYVLKPKGYLTILAVDGEEGVQLALEQNPDLMILDVELPRLDGMGVLHALKANGLSIPVIMSTAHGSEQVAIEAFRLGVRDYVPKPFEVNTMIKAIEHALAETRMRKERDELFAKLLQTNRSLEARLRELNTLYGISKSVTMLLDHDSLLRRIVEAAQFVTGAQMCLLRLYDWATGQLRIQAINGTRSTALPPENDKVSQQVMRAGQPVITPIAVAVPLKVGGKLIGTLDAINDAGTRPFLDHDMHLLQALADYAAIAIENSRLFRELEESKEREKQIIRNVFERYVTPAIVEQLLSSPQSVALGGARQPLAVMFADVRGFTSLAEQLQPELLFDALNYHLSLGAQAVLNHEGTLDKFMGDAIMAFFNAPLPQPDYALRAVAAAVEMQSRMTARAKTMPLQLRLQFGVGIACGEAVVGNIGTAQLMNYTAIGNSVNLARRLQEAAKGGQILIDENTYQAVQHHVRAHALEAIDVKGFSAPVTVYEVLGLRATERDSEDSAVAAP